MKANIIILIVLLLAVVGGAVWFITNRDDTVPPAEEPTLLSFEDCAAAGYPVMESYPRQCATPDGRTYAEELPAPEPTYMNASADLIRVSTPTPGAVTGKPVIVKGQARGSWYFEASFPIEIRDASGTVIATGHAEAEGDWMTSEFVPFTATITTPSSFIGEAVLTLMNDNPSGMPENARSVSFPITIEY